MKKLSRLKLNGCAILDDSMMKMIVGGSGGTNCNPTGQTCDASCKDGNGYQGHCVWTTIAGSGNYCACKINP